MSDQVRKFETGATRSGDIGRYDPEGFLSPIVLERFAEYMNKHRVQPDGSVRDSDNWQKGIPRDAYMKGMWRHFLHLWTRHRGYQVQDQGAAADLEEDLCALLFNVQGYLFELLKGKRQPSITIPGHILQPRALPAEAFVGGINDFPPITAADAGYREQLVDRS